MEDRRYHAFVSYCHADRAWADWLFRKIESFRVPKHLVGQERNGRTIPTRLSPVFKDREELASASSLSDAVTDALARSGALIVVCSPSARASQWVNEEVRQFKAVHGENRIFPFLVDPDWERSFPPALTDAGDGAGGGTVEPLAADVVRDGRSNALLKIVAGLLEVSYDELKQRDLQRRHRRLTWVTMASIVSVVVLASLVVRATLAEREAAFRQAQAEGLVQFMISDLRAKLQPIGRLDVLGDVGQQAMDYLSTVDADTEPAPGRSRRGKVIQQLGEIELEQGNVGAAIELFDRALAIQSSAFDMDPSSEHRYELSQANFWAGYGRWEAGDYEGAVGYLREYSSHSRHLVSEDPTNLDWQLEAVYADINLGTIQFEQADFRAALPEFRAATERLEQLVGRHPDDARLPATLIQGLAWMGGSFWELGEWQQAREAFGREVAVTREQADRHSNDYYRREELALALQRYALALARSGELAPALDALASSQDLARTLVEREPQNFYWRYSLARGSWYLGEVNEMLLHAEPAMAYYDEAMRGFDAIADDGRRPKFAIEHARLLNDAALLSIRSASARIAEEYLLHALALLEDQPRGREVDFTRAEALLALACMDRDRSERLQQASSLLEGYADVARPDYLALIELVAVRFSREPPAAADRTSPADGFEMSKFSGCPSGG